VKVTIAHGGTIVPVVVTTEADTELLDPEPAEQLRRLIAAVGPLGAGALGDEPANAPPAQPDRGAYRVTIADGEASRTAVMREQDVSPSVQELIDFVAAAPGAGTEVRPQGTADVSTENPGSSR
jgi:hypothetical protein